MATKRARLKKSLSKEVNVNIPLPKGKVGRALSKSINVRPPRYFSESWLELKKVTWPGRKESWKLTLAVVIFTAIFTLITSIADLGFNQIVERVLL
jgi:preprotein translocase subunit SecE